jgi:hypothetical protein
MDKNQTFPVTATKRARSYCNALNKLQQKNQMTIEIFEELLYITL